MAFLDASSVKALDVGLACIDFNTADFKRTVGLDAAADAGDRDGVIVGLPDGYGPPLQKVERRNLRQNRAKTLFAPDSVPLVELAEDGVANGVGTAWGQDPAKPLRDSATPRELRVIECVSDLLRNAVIWYNSPATV